MIEKLFYSSKTSIDGCWGSKIVKGSVGNAILAEAFCCSIVEGGNFREKTAEDERDDGKIQPISIEFETIKILSHS